VPGTSSNSGVHVLVQVAQVGDVPGVKENVLKGLHGDPPLLEILLQHQL